MHYALARLPIAPRDCPSTLALADHVCLNAQFRGFVEHGGTVADELVAVIDQVQELVMRQEFLPCDVLYALVAIDDELANEVAAPVWIGHDEYCAPPCNGLEHGVKIDGAI